MIMHAQVRSPTEQDMLDWLDDDESVAVDSQPL